MAITITDNNGRQYTLSGEEENLLLPLLQQNAESRIQLIVAIVEFDNRRLRLCADVLSGKNVGIYGLSLTTNDVGYKSMALGWINSEYNESMGYLRALLGEGADDMIKAYRSQAASGGSRPSTLMTTSRR